MQVLTDLYPWITGAIGGFLGAALLLPTKLGEIIFKYRVDRAIEAFKAEQGRAIEAFRAEQTRAVEAFKADQGQQLERLREQLNHIADRGKRSNELEFAALTAVWEQFIDAFSATKACCVRFLQIPAFDSMSSAQLDAFLLAIDFTDGQKQKLRNASDKGATYSDIMAWRSIVRAQNANFDLRMLLRKQGIFIPKSLRDEFALALEMLTAAEAEEFVNHQFKQSGIGYEKRSALIQDGEKVFEQLSAATSERLFRDSA